MIFSLLIACGPAPDDGAMLLLPDDLSVEWSPALDEDDNVGALFLLDAEVLDADGGPAEGVAVEITSGWSGVRPFAADALSASDGGAACGPSCERIADAEGRSWELRPTRRWSWDDAAPTGYLAGTTDNEGRFPFAVFLDSAPDVGDRAPVFLSIAVETGSFEIAVLDRVVESY